jgi:hypothetical protein
MKRNFEAYDTFELIFVRDEEAKKLTEDEKQTIENIMKKRRAAVNRSIRAGIRAKDLASSKQKRPLRKLSTAKVKSL